MESLIDVINKMGVRTEALTAARLGFALVGGGLLALYIRFLYNRFSRSMSNTDSNAQVPGIIEREVSASREEYCRGVRLAFACQMTEHGTMLRVDDGQATMEIALAAVAPRTIGALALPRLKVTLRFCRGTPQQRAALLARMDRAMQRGGG